MRDLIVKQEKSLEINKAPVIEKINLDCESKEPKQQSEEARSEDNGSEDQPLILIQNIGQNHIMKQH